jgi:hypothetical protein
VLEAVLLIEGEGVGVGGGVIVGVKLPDSLSEIEAEMDAEFVIGKVLVDVAVFDLLRD